MANLVPLHVDKDTGNIVAKKIKPGGGAPGLATYGFLHVQAVASQVWLIEHNEESDKVICQVYDDTGDMILPDRINILDINTLQVEFTEPAVGRAHVMFFDVR